MVASLGNFVFLAWENWTIKVEETKKVEKNDIC